MIDTILKFITDLLNSYGMSARSIVLIAWTAFVGLSIGLITFKGIRLGIAGCIFSGLLWPNLGFTVDIELLNFVKDASLILFIYMIGLWVGPDFFSAFKKEGLRLNLLALAIVVLGSILAIILTHLTKIPLTTSMGILAGAVTNTPALAAAEQLAANNPDVGVAYSVTYPCGVLGPILMILFLKYLARKDLPRMIASASPVRSIVADRTGLKTKNNPDRQAQMIFLGLLLGVLVGLCPLKFPGMPVSFKLGIAAGPLLIAIFLGRRPDGMWQVSPRNNLILREIGIVLFLSCIGLKSGLSFRLAFANGAGIQWVLYGLILTMVPLIIVSLLAWKFSGFNFFQISGVVAGSMTGPAALSYLNTVGHVAAGEKSYVAVYPLTMILRVLLAQIIILLGNL
ncbi:MAG: hypothetical protein J6Y94_07080 [Bacteriovoracaceae bacterium]|nr:hypothetical protein [Bacteriovoracaceae bacterium]